MHPPRSPLRLSLMLALALPIATLTITRTGVTAQPAALAQAQTGQEWKAEDVGKASQEANRFLLQGSQQYQTKDYSEAIQSWEQALIIYRKIKNRNGEANALISLGIVYISLSENDKAISFSNQALPIFREVKDRNGEAKALDNLGVAHFSLLQYEKAIGYYTQALSILRKVKDRNEEASTLSNLGIAHFSLSQYEKAIGYYTQALFIFREVKDRNGEANSLSSLGNAYSSLSQYEKAISYYTKALPVYQAVRDRNGEADVLNNLGISHSRLSDHEEAIGFFNQALLILREVKNRSGEAGVLNNLGLAYRSLSQYDKAIEFFIQALPISREVKDRNSEADVLTNLGNAYRSLSQYDKAIDYQNQALPIYQAIKNIEGEGLTLSSLGNAHISLSQYDKAIRYYAQALPIFRKVKDRNGEAIVLAGLGNAYVSLAQYDEAISYYTQALSIHQEVKNRNGKANALAGLGDAYVSLGQYDKAISYYTQALSISQAVKDHNSEANVLAGLGVAYVSLSQYDKAIDYYTQALPIYKGLKDLNGEAITLINLGVAYRSLSKYEKAIAYYQQALPILQQIKDRENEGILLSNLGSLLEVQKQPELAIVFYKQSVNIRETIRVGIRKLPRESQESYTQSVAGTYRALADLLLKQDRILEAQEVLELLKIQEFDNTFQESRGQRQPVTFRKAELELLKQFNAQQQGAILAAQELTTLQNKPEAQLTKQERDRINQLNQLQAKLADDFIQFISSNEVKTLVETLHRKDSGSIDPETLEELRNKFSNQLARLPNTALFYPLILDNRLELILITANANPIRRTVRIDRPTLNRAIADFRLALKNPTQDPKPSAQKLYDLLIQPIADDLQKAKIKTLLYSPDRRLRYVPLGALYDGKQWLIERLQISYVTAASITDLTTPRQTQPKVLAGAISNNPGQRYAVDVPPIHREFGGLPNVLPEITGIVTQLPNTRKLLAQDFTTDAIQTLSRQYNILHFATHGSFERQDPELSFILFGGKSRDGKNYATLRDIATWKLDTDLVVLSACETGLADDQFDTKADDSVAVMGLGYKFEQAGARATIASLWVVNDASTSLLMQQFYKQLTQSNLTKAEALRQAQLSFLNGEITATDGNRLRAKADPNAPPVTSTSGNPDFKHPYYWAPFILIGNSR